jgi:GTPase involved in cell partitioning and DNA repair
MVPLDADDLAAAYLLLRTEVSRYSPALAQRPHMVAWTKADLVPDPAELELPATPEAFASVVVSAVAQKGMDDLLEILWKRLRDLRESE